MSQTVNTIETQGLSKRYGSFWALKDCTIFVPQGSICALVGPNGAGKSTLLKLLAGLNTPSEGNIAINGKMPEQSEEFLAEVGYLAQEIPLYKNLSVEDHINLGKRLSSKWDEDAVRSKLQELEIPFNRAVGSLSGGQESQVGLALALAKKPRILLLDEPVAALDPLARHDFLTSLTEAVAEGNLTVIMSSHLLADLEQVCDHLIILGFGRTQVCDTIDDVLRTHRLIVGTRQAALKLPSGYTAIVETHTPKQSTLLVRNEKGIFGLPGWDVHNVRIEEVALGYLAQAKHRSVKFSIEGDK